MIVLLDTNVYSAMRRGDETVHRWIQRSKELLLSSIVIGELLFGFRNGSRYQRNVDELERFLEGDLSDAEEREENLGAALHAQKLGDPSNCFQDRFARRQTYSAVASCHPKM
jgi:predicted nucleic acid-binding protein